MGTSAKTPRNALAAVPLLVFLTLLFAQEARAQATITQAVGVTHTVYLDIGGPYGYTDLTAVSGASDLVITDSGVGGELDAGGTVSLSLPNTNWEWVPTACVATTNIAGASVSFTTPVNNQTLVATLAGGSSAAGNNITFTVLMARSVSTIVEEIDPATIGATTNSFNNMTNAAWGTTIAAVEGPSLSFTTPTDAGADSTDLADGDGGWDFGTVFTLSLNNTGDDANMQFWWSVDSMLTSVNDEEGAFRAYRDSSNVEVPVWLDVSASPTSQAVLTAGLSDWDVYNTEYYLYATSLETGDRRIARAGPIRVFHYPTNNLNQDNPNAADPTVVFLSNNADYLDSGNLLAQDDGTEDGSGTSTVTWNLTTIDFDHNADIKFYYSTDGSLTGEDLVLSGAFGSYVVTGLSGATLIEDSDGLQEDVDFTFTWDVYTDEDNFVPAGSYYIYVVSNDAYRQDVDVSSAVYHVSHSPLLIIQDPYPDGTTAEFDLRPDVHRFFNINWGLTVGGDHDPDDSATIAFYLAADADGTADFDQTNIATLTNTTTATNDDATDGELIYTTTINEDPDHQLENLADIDMWAWSEAFRASLNARVLAGDNIFLYGVITGGGVSRITTYASEDVNHVVTAGEDLTDGSGAELTITNLPNAHVTDPPPLGGAVGWGEAYRIAWEFAWDFGETNQNILLYVGTDNMFADATFDGTWDTGVVGLLDLTDHLWVANSTDGAVANNTGADYVITGLTVADSYDWQPHTMTGNSVGATGGSTLAAAVTNQADLYVYLVVSSAAAGAAPNAGDLVFQAPGRLRLTSDAGNTEFGYKLLPNQMTVTQGQQVDFRIYVDSGVPTAEVATVFMSCDTTYWSIATPSAPFTLNTTVFNSALVVENSNDQGNVTGGRHHLNLVYGANGSADANLSGGTNYLATLSLVAKHTGIINPMTTEIYFDQDPPNNRWTTFYSGQGNPLPVLVQLPAARAESYPLGELQGNVDLEGVNDFTGMTATVSVSPAGAIQGVEAWNDLFESTNDSDSTLPGVQVVLDQAGHYHLRNVPNGVYDFTVHVDGWLDGTIDVTVQHGDHHGDIDPIYTQRITQGLGTQRLQLLAGDCAGYTDEDGDTRPDNQVDATDLTAVKNAYDSTPDSSHWNALCDFERITTANHIYIPDLVLVNTNQGQSGVPLVYRMSGQSNAGASFRILDVPAFVTAGQEFEVTVRLEGASDVRGFDVRLAHPGFERIDARNGELLGGFSQADYLVKHQGAKAIWAGAVKGRERQSFAGSGEVFSLVLRAQDDGRPRLSLCEGSLVNSAFETTNAGLDNSAVLPADYLLGEAYPNPFNPLTSIQFAIPDDGLVKLAVYNMLGQKVRTLVNGPMSAGRHLSQWDSTNDAGMQVASGVYIYQIDVNGFSQARKMVLLK
jgi:hypothetical protein